MDRLLNLAALYLATVALTAGNDAIDLYLWDRETGTQS